MFFVKSKLYRRRLLKIIGFFPNVKKVVVPSREIHERFKSYLNHQSYKKLITIPNPLMNSHVVEKKISANNYSREDSPYLISVGRLNRLKGFEQLIKCFARAQFNNPISLIIIGSGALKPDLQALISELGMEERIELLGFHPFPQVFVIQAEALILNSTFECFPNVLTEALSLGVPVISNDCDYGPREIIYDRVNGLLFDQARDENLIQSSGRIC